MANERLAISLTFLSFLLLLLLSVFCATIDEACTVGKTLTPSSSFLSLGLKFAPGSPEKYLWKSSGLKCSEHTADWFCRLSMRSFRLDKINPFFTFFTGLGAIIAEERNNVESYTFSRLETLLQRKATLVVGILLHLMQASSLKTSTKGEMNLLVWRHDWLSTQAPLAR